MASCQNWKTWAVFTENFQLIFYSDIKIVNVFSKNLKTILIYKEKILDFQDYHS